MTGGTDGFEAFAAARSVGEFFAVEVLGSTAGWRPATALCADASARVAATRKALGPDATDRVAASIDFVGLVSRLVSPVLGAAVLTGVLPTATWWWHPELTQLGVTDIGACPAEPVAAGMRNQLLDPLVTPLGAAYGRQFRLSSQVLRGNVASALNGAASVLGDDSGAYEVVRALLSTGELAGTARSLPPHFVRNSCCLFYQLPGIGTCGDCVLSA